MKAERVECVSSLVSEMTAKQTAAEADCTRLKEGLDRLMDEAKVLETQAEAKRRAAKDLYEQIGSLDYGDWVSDILLPLADELAQRIGKKAKLFGPTGIGSKVTIALLDDPDSRWTEQDSLELTVEPDFSGDQPVFRYETGERSDRYSPETVGFINGLNNITVPLPDSVEEILTLFRMRPAVKLSKKEEKDDGCEG